MNITGRRGNDIAVFAVAVAILVVTLASFGSGEPAPFSFSFDAGRRGIGDAILNCLLFAPLGLAIAWNGRSASTAAVIGFVLATGIEVAQTILPGRDPALSDIILNTAGAAAGALIARWRREIFRPSPASSLVLTTAGLAIAASTMIATAYLLSPIPGSPVRADDELLLPVSAGDGPADIRTLLRVDVPSAPEPVFIALSANDLLLRYPSRGGGLGFDQPEYWRTGAFLGKASGEPTRVSLTRDRSRWRIAIGSDRETLGPTVGQGWAVLAYPDAIGRRWGGVVSALWLLAMFLPIGFWARGKLRFVAGIVSVLLLAAVPAITGAVASTPLEWAGAATGFLVGAVLGISRPKRSSPAP